MTAEIALLNKSAVALAADSAATVSSRDRQEKVFNSEDKLFELSSSQPIGVMIYNSTTFFETPVHVLIKRYRSYGRTFDTLDDAADDFRIYLRDFARSLDASVQERVFQRLWSSPLQLVQQRAFRKVSEAALNIEKTTDLIERFRRVNDNLQKLNNDEMFQEAVDFYVNAFSNANKADFTGRSAVGLIDRLTKGLIKDKDAKGVAFGKLLKTFLHSSASSPGATGFVIAGFAKNELFPSLRSFEIDGMLGEDLRYVNASSHDIKLDGFKARILPFAQQEMVDRFVSSIDAESEKKLLEKTRELLRDYRLGIVSLFPDADADQASNLGLILERAENKFVDALIAEGFGDLKEKSRLELEGMVEFMPKVDLAQMAESLVELTSIKRRLTRGFETVGGPIDVAVISRSEGFVWIKRKHYFPRELNGRFFTRAEASLRHGGLDHGNDKRAASIGH